MVSGMVDKWVDELIVSAIVRGMKYFLYFGEGLAAIGFTIALSLSFQLIFGDFAPYF